jgi:hypothetical protein
MGAHNRTKDSNGKQPGWIGHLVSKVPAAELAVNVPIDPPLRGIRCTGGSIVKVVYAQDLRADGTHDEEAVDDLYLVATVEKATFAIAMIKPGGNATGITGYR